MPAPAFVAGSVPDGQPAYCARGHCATALSYGQPSLATLREVASVDRMAFRSDWPFARQLFEISRSDVPPWAHGLALRDGDRAPTLCPPRPGWARRSSGGLPKRSSRA
jgi:hypothetical protein